ncbi:AMP-binding protein [Saccharothrix isguenensis]
MTDATEEFRAARDVLLTHREDLERARAEFRWPRAPEFNWALDWFDVVARDGDREALRVVGVAALTYAELSRRSSQVACWLRDLGVRRGDVVLLMCGTRPELWEVTLAAMKLGAVLTPTYPTATPVEIADRIARADVRHVVAEAGLVERFADVRVPGIRVSLGDVGGWTSYSDSADAPAEFTPDGPTHRDDPLFTYFTSGTTSQPKLIRHTHASYPVGHLSSLYWNGLLPGDVHLNLAAPGWAKHPWSSLFVPWTAEATVLAVPTPNPAAVLDALHAHRATSVCAPPTVWRGLIRHGLGDRPAALREATTAGEPLNPDLFHAIRDRWGIALRDGYGQTEATGMIGTTPGDRARPGVLGRPLPGYDIVLLGPDGVPGDEGEISVDLANRPAGIPTGVGHYRTGDLGVRHANGTITCLGRVDDVFKSFDHRISPHELERVLCLHTDVVDAAVVPVPHPIGMWVPKAFLVRKPSTTSDADVAMGVFDHMALELPPEKAVAEIEFVDVLPRTASGKVQRARLRTAGVGVVYRTDSSTVSLSRRP